MGAHSWGRYTRGDRRCSWRSNIGRFGVVQRHFWNDDHAHHKDQGEQEAEGAAERQRAGAVAHWMFLKSSFGQPMVSNPRSHSIGSDWLSR